MECVVNTEFDKFIYIGKIGSELAGVLFAPLIERNLVYFSTFVHVVGQGSVSDLFGHSDDIVAK